MHRACVFAGCVSGRRCEYHTLSTVWSSYYDISGGYKKTTICNTDDRQLMTLVNSASTVPLIGLPLKGAEFCHTLNILLVGR
jgi:hypothetical protein